MNKDEKYIQYAIERASNSKATKRKVGAVIVRDGEILSDGYNGTPSGFDNECEYLEYDQVMYGDLNPPKVTKPEVLHAESNAITKIAKSTESSEGATLYVTMSPCFECAKLIIQSGIVRVVFKDLYRKSTGLGLLKKAGVKVDRL